MALLIWGVEWGEGRLRRGYHKVADLHVCLQINFSVYNSLFGCPKMIFIVIMSILSDFGQIWPKKNFFSQILEFFFIQAPP